jgi:hypothetical protein
MLARHPELVAQFDREASATDTLETLSAGSRTLIWWRCPADPDHRWRPGLVTGASHRRSPAVPPDGTT